MKKQEISSSFILKYPIMLSYKINKKFNLSCRNRDKLTDEWPKAKEVLVHQKAHEASNKKFDLQEVEIWVTLASVMGALLALLGFQICRLCKTKTRNRMDSSRQMVMFNFDSLHDSFVHQMASKRLAPQKTAVFYIFGSCLFTF